MNERQCIECKTLFVLKSGHTKKRLYCSVNCSRQRVKREYRERNPRFNDSLPTATVGAVSELVVAVDLLQRGFPVFRAMSAACPCDLAILDNDKLLRIEVKTAYRTKGGQMTAPSIDNSRFDILALVLDCGRTIKYSASAGNPTLRIDSVILRLNAPFS